jgi:predicted nucleic acid-binding Zn ribbon protein
MPNCPSCGTWNPDDKRVCWRCQTELPKPPPQKKKRQLTSNYILIIALIMILVWFAVQFFWVASSR